MVTSISLRAAAAADGGLAGAAGGLLGEQAKAAAGMCSLPVNRAAVMATQPATCEPSVGGLGVRAALAGGLKALHHDPGLYITLHNRCVRHLLLCLIMLRFQAAAGRRTPISRGPRAPVKHGGDAR